MKIFNKKEEKNKVGRPKLADSKLKKTSLIMCIVCFAISLVLLSIGAYELNIIPNFNKLKGAANTSLCNEIPARFRPYNAETNPEGLHEYGFTDPKFYSVVLSTGSITNSYPYNYAYNSSTYCNTITEEQLASITYLNAGSSSLTNTDGVQYLTGLTSLHLSSNKLSSIDLSKNTALTDLELRSNNLSSIDVSKNTALIWLDLGSNELSIIDVSKNTALTSLSLNNNNLSIIDVSKNTALTNLYLYNNNLSSIDVSQNTALTTLYLYSNNLSNIDVSKNTALTSLKLQDNNLSSIDLSKNTSLKYLYLYSNNLSSIDVSKNTVLIWLDLGNNNLSSIDVSNNTALTYLNLSDNNFNKIYTTFEDKITIEEPDVKTAYPNDITYSIDNTNIAKYENGVIKKANIGSTTLKVTYKVSSSETFDVNYTIVFGGITSDYYTINYENKTIDLNDNIFIKNNIWINPYNYSFDVNKDTIEIKDNNGNLIDTYKLINARKEDENAYTKAGFKDKNLYTCVVRSYYDDEDISGNYLLTDEELVEIEYLYCYNVEIKDTTGLEKLTNLQFLILTNNNINGTLDLSKYENLEELYLQNNKLDNIILPNNPNFSGALLHGNNLKSVDLSYYTNLSGLTLQDNPLSTIYMLKNTTMKYSDILKLNSSIEVEYEIEDENVATYNNDTIKALKDGITTLKLYNENIASILPEFFDKCNFDYDNNEEYCNNVSEEEVMLPYFMSNEIKVYDIKSDAYKIDKDKKTIDVKGTDLDVSKVTLTLSGLKGSVEGNYYVIKDGTKEVDKYKILNPKEVVKEEITTTKKEVSNKSTIKTTTKSNATTTKDNNDIELSTSIVPSILLQSIKGKDRNIVVTKDNITFTINGKDIENINGNIDLSVEIEDIEKTILKEELKEKVEKAVVLNFKNESELPGKVLVEVNVTDDIKENVGEKDINVYNYNKDKYNLIAQDLSLNNNKIKFYVDKLGYYVLTNENIDEKYMGLDSSMLGENNKLNKEIKSNKVIIPIVIFVILITLGIVGYICYRKKGKNSRKKAKNIKRS